MKRIYFLILIVAGVATFTACNKYLNVQPKGYQLLTTTSDYDAWLNSDALEMSEPNELNLLQDNIDEPNIPIPPSIATDLAYTWSAQFDQTVTDAPLIWTRHYQSINLFNTVIQNIGSATGSEQQKVSLKAEALLGRAFEYLYLVNEYGKPYNAATAATDPAVPFVTSYDLTTSIPNRSTVEQIYDQIIADINDAIPNLPSDNSQNRFRGSIAAAYAVLARTYLYMNNYSMAQKYAQLALVNGPNTIVDFNITTNSGNPSFLSDAIYARFAVTKTFTCIPTLNYLQSFNINDLRLKLYCNNLGNYTFLIRGLTTYYSQGAINGSNNNIQNWGPTVAEMRLIISESAARSGDLSTALQQLDSVRKCRIATTAYIPYQSSNQDSVLQHVLNERAFEFSFNGMRWFDMRRLNAEGLMPTINRYDGQNNIIATLAPTSPRYILQIPLQVMYYHTDWQQNP